MRSLSTVFYFVYLVFFVVENSGNYLRLKRSLLTPRSAGTARGLFTAYFNMLYRLDNACGHHRQTRGNAVWVEAVNLRHGWAVSVQLASVVVDFV